jgi:hypothetical protein
MLSIAKWAAVLLFLTAITTGAGQRLNRGGSFAVAQSGSGAQARGAANIRPRTQVLQPDEHHIVPGSRVGPLRIGDSKETAFRLFVPKAGTDLQYDDECGSAYDWVQLDGAGVSRGNVTIRFRHGVVTQIESGSPTYATDDGVRLYDSPDKVRRHWHALAAYALLPGSPDATGGLPLIFWVNEKRGIAFEFAFSQEKQQRYLYSTIVFAPDTHFCTEGQGESPDSRTWRPLPPYATQANEHP